MPKSSQLIIVLLLALIPFVSTNLTYDPTLIKTTLIKTAITAVLAIYLINSLKDRKISIKKIFPVFFLILLASYVTLNFILKYPIASADKFLTTLLFFCFFFVLAHLSFIPRFIQIIIWQVFLITSLIGLSCIISYFTHFSRTRIFFYNPNFLASFFVFSIPLSLCLLHEKYKKYLASKQFTKIDLLLYLLILIQIGGFITTVSRAGSLGFSASILFLIFLRGPKRWRQISLFLLIVIISFSILVMSMPQVFIDLIGVRTSIWQGTHKMIRENLLAGHGIGSFSKVYPCFRVPQYFSFLRTAPMTLHAHNEFLEIWAELGIIGLLLNLCFIISVFSFALKKAGKTRDTLEHIFIHGALAGIAGLFIHNIFSVSLRFPFISFYLWFGCGMSIALSATSHPLRRSHPSALQSVARGTPSLKINLENRFKRLLLSFLFLGLIILVSVKFILFPFLGGFYFKKGYLERRKGNFTQAISYYSYALNFSPEPQEIYYRRAFILNKMGKEKEALEDYLKIEEISPGYAEIYRNMGITYISLEDLTNAIEKLKQAIAQNPYDSHAYNSLGVAYAKKGWRDMAIEEFQRALSIDPDLKEAHLNLIKLGNDYIP